MGKRATTKESGETAQKWATRDTGWSPLQRQAACSPGTRDMQQMDTATAPSANTFQKGASATTLLYQGKTLACARAKQTQGTSRKLSRPAKRLNGTAPSCKKSGGAASCLCCDWLRRRPIQERVVCWIFFWVLFVAFLAAARPENSIASDQKSGGCPDATLV